jgi:hypothetical protein
MLAAGTLAGCVYNPPPPVVQGSVVVTRPAPPPPRVEIRPAAPDRFAVWDPGRWTWNGREYVWVPGHYLERPSLAMQWQPGYWSQTGGGWVWIDGHWY